MKKIIGSIALIFLSAVSFPGKAQNINWRSLREADHHVVTLNVGWDYSATVGVGYGYKLPFRIPMLLSADFSLPTGSKLFDDFKSRVGLQAEVLRLHNFSVTAKAYGIFRQYQSAYVKMDNFGSEFSLVAGYYKPTWYVAAEGGFDKAITTHITHSGIVKDNNPGVQDGWYIPTGGNFYYGLQGGVSFKSNDFYLKVGKTITQDLQTTALIPLYFQVGYSRRF